jgi:hypothetical protein
MRLTLPRTRTAHSFENDQTILICMSRTQTKSTALSSNSPSTRHGREASSQWGRIWSMTASSSSCLSKKLKSTWWMWRVWLTIQRALGQQHEQWRGRTTVVKAGRRIWCLSKWIRVFISIKAWVILSPTSTGYGSRFRYLHWFLQGVVEERKRHDNSYHQGRCSNGLHVGSINCLHGCAFFGNEETM